jgi:hypothetical protein
MSILLIFIVLFAAIAGGVMFARRAAPAAKVARVDRSASAAKPEAFGSVELVPGARCCGAAQELSGTRILAAEAPALPLDGCELRCNCAYKRYTDRRHINRRRGDDGLPEHFIYSGEENREGSSTTRRSRRLK